MSFFYIQDEFFKLSEFEEKSLEELIKKLEKEGFFFYRSKMFLEKCKNDFPACSRNHGFLSFVIDNVKQRYRDNVVEIFVE